jgi:hypothetical protein
MYFEIWHMGPTCYIVFCDIAFLKQMFSNWVWMLFFNCLCSFYVEIYGHWYQHQFPIKNKHFASCYVIVNLVYHNPLVYTSFAVGLIAVLQIIKNCHIKWRQYEIYFNTTMLRRNFMKGQKAHMWDVWLSFTHFHKYWSLLPRFLIPIGIT